MIVCSLLHHRLYLPRPPGPAGSGRTLRRPEGKPSRKGDDNTSSTKDSTTNDTTSSPTNNTTNNTNNTTNNTTKGSAANPQTKNPDFGGSDSSRFPIDEAWISPERVGFPKSLNSGFFVPRILSMWIRTQPRCSQRCVRASGRRAPRTLTRVRASHR